MNDVYIGKMEDKQCERERENMDKKAIFGLRRTGIYDTENHTHQTPLCNCLTAMHHR